MTVDDTSGKSGATLTELPTPRHRDRTQAADQRRRAERTAIVVAGMHRSGTSALTRVFNLLGCDLPKTLMGAGVGNELGHWESDALTAFNDQVLESAGSSWSDWLAINVGWYRSPKAEQYKAEAREVLEREFAGSRLFVLKDPRVCRLLPFWLDVIESAAIAPRLVLPVRNPLEVAASLQSRDGFEPGLGHLIWLRHVLDAEAASRGRPRLFCSYERLLSGWPHLIQRVETSLGVAFPRALLSAEEEINAFLAERHRHHRSSRESVCENIVLSSWLRDAYRIFDAWAGEGERAEDYATLDEISQGFDAAAPAFAKVVQAGQRAAEKARHLERECAQIAGERDLANETAAQLRGQLSEAETAREQGERQLRAELAAVSARLSEAERSVAAASSERDAIAGELEAARATLSERDASNAAQTRGLREELDEARRALAARQREAEALAHERDGLAMRLRDFQDRAASAAAEREALKLELAAARAALTENEAAHEAQVQSLRSEVAALTSEREALTHDFERYRAQSVEIAARQSEQFRQLIQTQWQRSQRLEQELLPKVEELEARLHHSSEEIAKLTLRLAEQEQVSRDACGEAERLRQQLSVSEHRFESASRAADELRHEQEHLAARLEERFGEIAVLSRMLRDQEMATRRAADERDWLRRVAATLMAGGESWRGRLFNLLPGFAIRGWAMRHLQRQALFDNKAYLQAHPDVARAGVNGLRHYIHFGMAEGRRKG